MKPQWYLIEDVNPEPWKSPDIAVVKRGGKYVPQAYKPEAVRTYQEALIEEFRRLYPDTRPVPYPCRLHFFFWRQLATPADRRADATNLQKATEDALQGLLVVNDVQVIDVHSRIIQQSPTASSRVLIELSAPSSLPETVYYQVQRSRADLGEKAAQKVVGGPRTDHPDVRKSIEDVF